MNISVLGPHSSYHHLAQLFHKEGSNVFHYGANCNLVERENYHPLCYDLPISGDVDDFLIDKMIDELKSRESDFLIASGIPIPRTKRLHDFLLANKIPYFFVKPEFATLETNKSKTKKMLAHLKIPTPEATSIDGKYLFENFYKIQRPFVVKLNYVFQYGKQTVIVNDSNIDEVYLDLFSVHISRSPRITNIGLDTNITLEKFVKLKREYSYHLVANSTGWKYIGSARDYKQIYENDTGFNTLGMGAYNTIDIDSVVHDYADKIINFLKGYLGINYKGFMFIGIGVDENDNHLILEINTRSGDPELQVILNSIDNNLSDLFLSLSNDESIPEIIFNSKKSVTVRVVNKIFDWTKPAKLKPNFNQCPPEIIQSLEGGSDFYMSHSVFTASSTTINESSKIIYDYLNSHQSLGQFFYRKDVGILK